MYWPRQLGMLLQDPGLACFKGLLETAGHTLSQMFEPQG